MLKTTTVILLALTVLPSPVLGEDLYQVKISSAAEADQLASLDVDPLIRLTDGYLVLGSPDLQIVLAATSLRWERIADDVSRDRLALDGRRDRLNADRFIPVYDRQGVRLFRLDTVGPKAVAEAAQLFPIGSFRPDIEFAAPALPQETTTFAMDDLQTLIAQVDADSLESYVLQLQAFNGRAAGTASNIAARDWIYAKFAAFGYDSVFLDPFPYSANGSTTMYNVVATRLGTTYPDRHILVGAHHDGVVGSPAADDNGSGVAGVLELARILKDVDTDMTFVFATFDAEEYGLHGSWYYADRADAEGEDIRYMLNMDMIANYTNTNQAELMYGADRSYAELWQVLADSLLGVEGIFGGASGASDHYPFTQYGIPVTFVAEYIFSSVYHTYRDSTSYMDFDYMAKLVKGSLATAYVAGMPAPSLSFAYPAGLPDWLEPDNPTSFQVQVTGDWGGHPVPASALLYYSADGAAYSSAPLTDLGGNLFEAAIPALGCAEVVEFYVSIQDLSGETFVDPGPSAPHWAVVAAEITPVLVDNFEAEAGWTVAGVVTEGSWERAVPTTGGTRGEPAVDYDGSGYCFVTDNGANADIDGGTTILFSPLLDLSGGRARISYARWYSNDFGSAPNQDVMRVYITNGGLWELVEEVGPAEQAAGGWIVHSFLVQDFVVPNASIMVRFEASDLGDGSVVEAAIDAFNATSYQCQGQLAITTESLPSGELGVTYSQQLEAVNVVGTAAWTDKFGELAGTGLSLTGDGLLAGTPIHSGVVSFTAEVNDGIGLPDDRLYTFAVTSCCAGRVGDANDLGGDEPTIGDVSTMIDALFISGLPDPIVCLHEADVNQSGGPTVAFGDITIGDISVLIDYLFITGPSLGLPDCL